MDIHLHTNKNSGGTNISRHSHRHSMSSSSDAVKLAQDSFRFSSSPPWRSASLSSSSGSTQILSERQKKTHKKKNRQIDRSEYTAALNAHNNDRDLFVSQVLSESAENLEDDDLGLSPAELVSSLRSRVSVLVSSLKMSEQKVLSLNRNYAVLSKLHSDAKATIEELQVKCSVSSGERDALMCRVSEQEALKTGLEKRDEECKT